MKQLKHITIFLFVALLITGCSDTVQITQESEGKALRIHEGTFAFCGASAAVPTGKKIVIQGVEYDEGCAICPVQLDLLYQI